MTPLDKLRAEVHASYGRKASMLWRLLAYYEYRERLDGRNPWPTRGVDDLEDKLRRSVEVNAEDRNEKWGMP